MEKRDASRRVLGWSLFFAICAILSFSGEVQAACQDCQECLIPFNPRYAECCTTGQCLQTPYCSKKLTNVSDCADAGGRCNGGVIPCGGGGGTGGGTGGNGGSNTCSSGWFCPAECFSCSGGGGGGIYY